MRRAVALLAPAFARRSAAPGAAALGQPLVPGGWLRFCAAAKPDSAAAKHDSAAVGEAWYNKPEFSVKELSDEIFRRWTTAPTPSKFALDSLLRRVKNADEAKLAAKAIERFHGLRCEAGWLTGVGAVTSAEFSKACLRVGAEDVAVAAFARAPLVGLTVSPDVCCRLLAATAVKDADMMLDAYRKLREAGLQVTMEVARYVLKGLQGPVGGGSPKRALAAAVAFEKSGVKVGRRSWNALLCAAASAVDVETVDGAVAAMALAGETLSSTAHLAVAAAALLKGDTPAAVAAFRASADLESKVKVVPKQLKASGSGEVPTPKEISAEILTCWASNLAKGASTPGGVKGLEARTREALATADNKLPVDLASMYKGAELLDGTAAPAAAAPATAAA